MPKSTGKAPAWAPRRLREHAGWPPSETVDGIMEARKFKQALCKYVVSLLSECFMEIDIMSGWGTLSLLSVVNRSCLNI